MAWQPQSRRRSELPANWAAIRQAVLRRDHYQCTIRGPHCTGTATHADHTDEALGPHDHRLEVLRAACRRCHMARTQAQSRAAMPRRQRPAAPHPGLIE